MSLLIAPLETNPEHPFHPIRNPQITCMNLNPAEYGPDWCWWVDVLPHLQLVAVVTFNFCIHLLDLYTGTHLWAEKINMKHQDDSPPIIDGDGILFLHPDGYVEKYEIDTGRLPHRQYHQRRGLDGF
jgi:hypothetical protein